MNLPACLITRWESLIAACAAAGAGAATTLLAMLAHELNDCSECNDCNEREGNEWGQHCCEHIRANVNSQLPQVGHMNSDAAVRHWQKGAML